ncbi:MAG: bacterioferritin [Chloroflexota bacterium]|nr:bacterioferritin [Dehalococcoidia bacterium]MDW8253253.1 bacterioferritin [Chloroflexota bacterium]
MKSDPAVLDILNQALANELTAVDQYAIHAAMCQNWGFELLHDRFRALSIEEMRDTEALIKYILFREGKPNIQRLSPLRVGSSVEEMLHLGRETELGAIATLQAGIAVCNDAEDYATRAMLEEMIREEQEHVEWFETQLEIIRQIGLEYYLSRQLRQG